MSITVKNLDFSYTDKQVLKQVSFEAGEGQLLAVLGPNGVGKTTLFRCILGLEKKYKGLIAIDGNTARNMSAKQQAQKIAYIPQIRQQVFGFSVMDMVLMGTSHEISGFGVPGKKETGKALEALDMIGIRHLAEKDYARISGGEQQMVLIARALAQQSRNLLMDEPTSALDYGNQTKVMNVVRRLADTGYCIVLSTHNPQHAIWYADKALALSGGEVAAWDSPDVMMTGSLIERLYGIEVDILNTDSGPLITPEMKRKTKVQLKETKENDEIYRD